ncbi:hypothetical protein ACUXIL_005523, partial [Ralstonia pickettii]
DKSARVAAQDEIGDVCQVLMNVQRVKQVDALLSFSEDDCTSSLG